MEPNPALSLLHASNPKPDVRLSYGTAGFRTTHTLLPSTCVRMGVLAAIRSRFAEGQFVGVMVTASHNPESDNGIKLTDPSGGMLSQVWEPPAERLANASTERDLIRVINKILTFFDIDDNCPAFVLVGRDTRPHSSHLADLVKKGAETMSCSVFDLGKRFFNTNLMLTEHSIVLLSTITFTGEVTTPQLHFAVQKANEKAQNSSSASVFDEMTVESVLEEYYSTLAKGYSSLVSSIHQLDPSARPLEAINLVVDASYGIGSKAALEFAAFWQKNYPSMPPLILDVRNQCGQGLVNEGCGAELVQKGRVPPAGVDASTDLGKLICSFDGDADRIVFHSFKSTDSSSSSPSNCNWVLFDGDKEAAIAAVMIFEEFRHLDNLMKESGEVFTAGCVQTAYANGASCDYLKRKGVNVVFARTGVKFLHHKAEKFDIGVYFEANGHGTVLFSPKLLKFLNDTKTKLKADPADSRCKVAVDRLLACSEVINQAVGDALSDMLLVLAAMQVLGMDQSSWEQMYSDLPSRQLKVPVANKSIIRCSEDEMRAEAPIAMQNDLDECMKQVKNGRCFVRPSGTEDVVRVYSEAATEDGAKWLADKATEAIITHVGAPSS